MKTYLITAIINGLPGRIILKATCEVSALEQAKASLPKSLRLKKDAQFNVTEI